MGTVGSPLSPPTSGGEAPQGLAAALSGRTVHDTPEPHGQETRTFGSIDVHVRPVPDPEPRVNRPTRANTPARAPLTFSLHADTPLDGRAWGWAGLLVIAAYAVAALVMVFGPHRIGDILTETDFYGSYGPAHAPC
jgi:hypothetical protein